MTYIKDLQRFETFGIQLKKWLHDKSEKEIFTKFLHSPTNNDLDTLISTLKQISSIHDLFLSNLIDRYAFLIITSADNC